MSASTSARRYARAIFEIAVERSELDKWRKELDEIASVFGDPQLCVALQSPRMPFGSKQQLLTQVLPGLSPLAMNLTYLLVKAGRVSIAGRVAEIYGELADVHQGIVHAYVASAVELSDDDRRYVSDWLGKSTGKTVVMEIRTDPAIIGGLVVRVGDNMIDASVRTRLEKLKRSLMGVGGGT